MITINYNYIDLKLRQQFNYIDKIEFTHKLYVTKSKYGMCEECFFSSNKPCPIFLNCSNNIIFKEIKSKNDNNK